MKKVGLLCGREYSFPPAFIVRVNELGKKDGVAAEFVKLGGTRMGEPSGYSVIVDRISHEVEYYRGYLKHAVLQGTYVINNPFWWTADDKFFNYAVAIQARHRHSQNHSAAAKGLSQRRRHHFGISSQSLLSRGLGWPSRLRRPPRHSQAFFRRRLEARLQSPQQRRASRRLRQNFSVLHDPPGVHQLHAIRPLLHLRKIRHLCPFTTIPRSANISSITTICLPSLALAS